MKRLRRLRIRFEDRVRIGLCFMLFVVLVFVGTTLYSLHRIISEQNHLVSVHAEELILAERARVQLQIQHSTMSAFVLSGRGDFEAQYHRAHERFTERIAELLLIATDDDAQKLLKEIAQLEGSLYSDIGLLGIKMRDDGASAEKVHEYFVKQGLAKTELLQTRLDDFVRDKLDEYNDAKIQTTEFTRNTMLGLLAISLISFGLIATIVVLQVKYIGQKKVYNINQALLLEKERRLSAARKEVLEIVSHDLRNPLSTIAMSLDLLREQRPQLQLTDGQPDYLSIISRSAESMKKLINDILDHAKIESGTLELEKKPCDLSSFMAAQVQQLSVLAQRKNIKIINRVYETIPKFNCDQDRIAQVIANLLGNAIKFTPINGIIDIDARVHGKEIILAMTNTGKGIPSDQLPHIFDRFWQARATAKQGTGLGLAISKAIIEAHGGRIWVESEVDKATTFFVALPADVVCDGPSEPVPAFIRTTPSRST